jgi:NAD(P)-dependent dehydrogenase (short-subunit alcohol dehydrogenase family)
MNNVAVITGTSSGMGQATAQFLLDEGWTVIALDVATTTLEAHGGQLIAKSVDVTDRDAVAAAVAAAVPTGSTIGLVANVAGVYPPTTLETFTTELYRRVFDVNVLGVLNVIAAADPYLRAESSIVNIASVDAFAVSPGQLLYGASKAAVVMLTKSLALELAPRGVRVNAIAPGWVDTPGNRATGRMEEAARGIPLGRVADPREIAEWVHLLWDRRSHFMTGETIVLSGGDVIR